MIVLLLMCPALALADDSGVLAEGELNDWIVGVLRKSAAREPLNAPVGEESRTEDGYAFIYDFATLYYDKPVLDETSVLLAVSLTSEIYPGPRNIYLGDAETVLTGTYGWQNPALAGDGVFAALIVGVLQGLFADRQEFAFIIGCSRRLGKPAYFRGP